MHWRALLCTVVMCLVTAAHLSSSANADPDIIGPAVITDGDTIKIDGQRIRLHGIDAPEAAQTCQADGEAWGCGQAATEALKNLTEGKEVRCEERDVDRYDRIVAVCCAGGVDLNEEMVRLGLALAYRRYSLDYVEEEEEAQAESVGMWRGEFVSPWEWRASQK